MLVSNKAYAQVLFLFALIILPLANTAKAQVDPNFSSIDAALEKANQEGKSLAVYLYSKTWDAPNRFSLAVPTNRAIDLFMTQFVLVNVDVESEKGKEWAARYSILEVYPSLSLTDAKGDGQSYLSLIDEDVEGVLSFFLEHQIFIARTTASN